MTTVDLDPSLLVDCRSTPRRPLNHPDLTHDWTPQHYPSGAIGGYYCPDCLIAGAPTSTPCPDRVGALVAEVRRLTDELAPILAERARREAIQAKVRARAQELHAAGLLPGETPEAAAAFDRERMLAAFEQTRLAEDAYHAAIEERDEARAALAAARVDGARGMRDHIADHFAEPAEAPASIARSAVIREIREIREIRALDPATVGSAKPEWYETERRAHDWIAFVRGDRTRWESGNTQDEAIGKLTVSWGDHARRVVGSGAIACPTCKGEAKHSHAVLGDPPCVTCGYSGTVGSGS